MHEKYHSYYPPADPDELKIAQAAQKAKREARRVQVQQGGNIQNAILEELGEEEDGDEEDEEE